MSDEYVHAPQCTADWLAVSRKFDLIWNFPHCIGMCNHTNQSCIC